MKLENDNLNREPVKTIILDQPKDEVKDKNGLPFWNEDFDKLCEEKHVPYIAVVPLFNFIKDLLTQQKEAIKKEWREKIENINNNK